MRLLLSLLSPALCVACGGDARWRPPLCRDCWALMRPLPQRYCDLWAAFPYDGPAGAVVRALKFDGYAGLADTIAAQLAAHAPPGFIAGVVVPVPVHPEHRRRRGVDHAAAIARALAQRAGLEFRDCLERTGDPRPQVGRGRRARMRGPLGAIRVRHGCEPPERALLVDDVVTTGATLAACIRALERAGSRQVTAIAYARTGAR